MTQNHPASGQAAGLQPATGRHLPADAKKKGTGEFVDMQELLPVMSSFQEHLAAEQQKNQSRMKTMITLFAILFAVFLIVPVYMGRVFLQQSRASLEAQKAAQDNLAQSLSGAMGSLTQASRELREELVRQRETRVGTVASVVTEASPVVFETRPEPVPDEPRPARRKVGKVEEPAPNQSEQTPVVAQEIEQPQPEAESVTALIPEAPINANPGDLEVLLKQVEDAINQKERELKSRQ